MQSEGFSYPALAGLRRTLDQQALTPAEVCARYVLLHLHRRHPKQWLSSPRVPTDFSGRGESEKGSHYLLAALYSMNIVCSRRQLERLENYASILELFQSYYFRGVVLDSHEGLVGWMEKRYPLIFRRDIPTPDEMLTIQCEGRRYVTLLTKDHEQFVRYGRHQDACAFLLHDFEHAHKFFGDPQSHHGQVQVFRRLQQTLPLFARWQTDEQFTKDLDYLKSDMNSHPVHLIKYLKAIVLSAEMRQTGSRWPELNGFWSELFSEWQMQTEVRESALRINQPESEQESDLIAVARFFACEPETAGAR